MQFYDYYLTVKGMQIAVCILSEGGNEDLHRHQQYKGNMKM